MFSGWVAADPRCPTVIGASAASVEAFTSAGGGDLTQVSDVSLSEQLAQVPPLAGMVVELVTGIYAAFSLAIADTFWMGLAVTLAALVVVAVGLQDRPIRALRHQPVPAAEPEPEPEAAPGPLAT